MGADYVALVGCPLEEEYGAESLCMRLKAAAQVDALLPQREAYEKATGKKLEDAPITISGLNNDPRHLTFADLSELAASVAICDVCTSIFGSARGAYRYVAYPLDAAFERSLFDYVMTVLRDTPQEFVTAVDAKGKKYTAVHLLYQFVIAELLAMDARTPFPRPFRTHRGEGGIVELAAPLGGVIPEQGIKLDSGIVLTGVFHPIDRGLALQMYAAFFRDYVRYIDALSPVPASRTIGEVRDLASFMATAVAASSTRDVTMMFDG